MKQRFMLIKKADERYEELDGKLGELLEEYVVSVYPELTNVVD